MLNGLINSDANGATEEPGSSNSNSLFVFLAGPIRHWWKPGLRDTDAFHQYVVIRQMLHDSLSSEFLVYAPHLAWRGSWNEIAQEINDLAVLRSHVLIYLAHDDVIAEGTFSEIQLAKNVGIPCFKVRFDSFKNFHEDEKAVMKSLINKRAEMYG